MGLRLALIQALEDKYNAQISAADATIKIYLTNSVGIGEHPQHLEEMDNAIPTNGRRREEKIKSLQPFKL